jgi:geranylgeranyl diphosphate synthase type II
MEELRRRQGRVEEALAGYFNQDVAQKTLLEAMRYSLLAGGKRIRPVLTLAFCAAGGGDEEKALPVACAVEMLHTYSLIHDDLPCMDNDDLRRGRPTNHKVFGEMTAVLAGDALQSAAYEAILRAPLRAEVRAAAALELSDAAGALGMCGGQQLDMEGEERALSLEEIAHMNGLKTGCLLRAACVMGVLAAGYAPESPQCRAAGDYAAAIGLAFQIRDDMLNVTSTAQEMGKSVGSDAENHKSTFVAHLGLEGCQRRVEEETAKAKKALSGVFADTAFLEALADYLAGREN